MKRILLVGATGYLGSYIAKELQKRDFFVKVIKKPPKSPTTEKGVFQANISHKPM
jgi:nucleoside-diphosphate-sugar epimerase